MRKNAMYYIHIGIFLLITFGIGFLPPFAQVTELGMRVLGVFLGIIYGWLFVGLDWPSLIALCALSIIGYGESADSLFLIGWSFMTIPPMILSFILAEGLAQTKLTDYIANKLLSIKLFAGKPFALMTGILIAQMLMALTQSQYASLFLLWSLAATIAAKAGYPKKNIFTTTIVTSTVAVFVWSSFVFPFAPGTLAQIAFFKQGMPNADIPFFGWIIVWLIFTLVYCLIWPLIAKYILRLDFSPVSNIDLSDLVKNKDSMHLTKEQKFGLVVLIGFMVAMFVPKLLPAEWMLTQALNKLGLTGCLAIAVSIMAAYKKEDGTPFLTLQKAANAISWNVIWLLVATQPIAAAFNAPECGIMPSLMAVITPILTTLDPTVFMLVCILILGLVTQFVHNMVLMVVFYPILCPLYLQMGGNPFVMFMGLLIGMNAAFATPAASWNSAMMFGVDGAIKSKLYIQGILHFLLSILLFFIIGLPLAKIFLPY